MSKVEAHQETILTGRCYCGASIINASRAPITISYCHCTDCRRWTGAPVAAFAAFKEQDFMILPNEGRRIEASSGVSRTFCTECGSPLTGRYDYLPNKVYISLSLFDQADDLVPSMHSHEANRLRWLHIKDDIERMPSSARSTLNSGSVDD